MVLSAADSNRTIASGNRTFVNDSPPNFNLLGSCQLDQWVFVGVKIISGVVKHDGGARGSCIELAYNFVDHCLCLVEC